jgi:hypothetical protein
MEEKQIKEQEHPVLAQPEGMAWSVWTLGRLRVAQGQRGYGGSWGLSDPVTVDERVLA